MATAEHCRTAFMPGWENGDGQTAHCLYRRNRNLSLNKHVNLNEVNMRLFDLVSDNSTSPGNLTSVLTRVRLEVTSGDESLLKAQRPYKFPRSVCGQHDRAVSSLDSRVAHIPGPRISGNSRALKDLEEDGGRVSSDWSPWQRLQTCQVSRRV
ncbi:hypothetical protein Bbelb_298230 [Branchiostoma belcheri]|nr:hypothetical protein Bbelb_298230 [Branchiostoma belcheri]